MVENEEYYTTEQASQRAIEYCEKHKGWKRICDVEDIDKLYYDWNELKQKERDCWINEYGKHSAEDAWREFGKEKCKVKIGFISGKGEFYSDVLKVPRFHNLMQIFKTT